jgi:phage tail tape-measure protein
MPSYVDSETGLRYESYKDSKGRTGWRVAEEGGTVVGGATVKESQRAFGSKAGLGLGAGMLAGGLTGLGIGAAASGPLAPVGAAIGGIIGMTIGGISGVAAGRKASEEIIEDAEDRLKSEQEDEAEAQKKSGAQALAAKEAARIPAGKTDVLASGMPTGPQTKGPEFGGASSFYERRKTRYGY